MKEKRLYKKFSGFCLVALCMISAMLFTVLIAKAGADDDIDWQQLQYKEVEKVPEGVKKGYVFAGWYDAQDGNALTAEELQVGDTYTAKVVPEEVLGIKAQVSTDLINDENTDKAAIRFLTSIDSVNYQKVGFYIEIEGRSPYYTSEKSADTNFVYREVQAVKGAGDGENDSKETVTPGKLFDNKVSQFFKIWTIGKIDKDNYDTEIKVTPYWITVDGTRVMGKEATVIKTVNLGRSWIYVSDTQNAEDREEYGTLKHPYTNFADALEKILVTKDDKLCGTIFVTGNVDTETVTIDENKIVTITSKGEQAPYTITYTGEDAKLFDVFGTLTLESINTLSQDCGIYMEKGAAVTATDVNIKRTKDLDNPTEENSLVYISNGATFTLNERDGESYIDGNMHKGRGVYVGGIFNFNAGTICNNGRDGGRLGDRGAGVLVAASGTFTMNETEDNSTVISNNWTTSNGAGAGVSSSGIFILNGGTIKGNDANGNAGGILAATKSTFEMNGGTVVENRANYAGGGIMIQSTNATIKGGTIKGNTAEGNTTNANIGGGGIYVHANGALNMTGGIITGNIATKIGGGIYIATTTAGAGANAKNEITGGRIGGSIIEDKLEDEAENTAANGAGVYVATDAPVTLGGSLEINGNKASENGGGAYVAEGTVTLGGSLKIQKNTATTNGGGVYVDNDGLLSAEEIDEGAIGQITISGNSARSGGGFYLDSTSEDAMNTIANAMISKNDASYSATANGTYYYGGGIWQNNGSLTIINSTVTDNTARQGGGIYVAANKNITIDGSKITKNKVSGSNGGGIYAVGSNQVMLKGEGEISENEATGTVQGLFLNPIGTGKVTLYTSFKIGGGERENEIRFNTIGNRDKDKPILIIVGESWPSDYTLNLGFHSGADNPEVTAYIRCEYENGDDNMTLANDFVFSQTGHPSASNGLWTHHNSWISHSGEVDGCYIKVSNH